MATKTNTTTRQQPNQAGVRLARVVVVRDEGTVSETPVVVCVGAFRVEVSGDFSSETLAVVLDVLEGLQH
jgi:hypothetical protein